jgi:hypothetical protein
LEAIDAAEVLKKHLWPMFCAGFPDSIGDAFGRTTEVWSRARWSQIQMFASASTVAAAAISLMLSSSGKLKEAVRKAAQLDQRTLSSLIERLLTEHCQQVGTLRRP